MRLDEFRKKNDISQKAFGEKLAPPVGQSLVSQWELGETRITLGYAVDIARKTNNEVTVEDCLSMYVEPKSKDKSGT